MGTILPYAGDLGKIPNGWALCDGNNGTPDLRDRFLTGVGLTYNLGDSGGENFHTLTIPELPPHTHPFSSENLSVLYDLNRGHSQQAILLASSPYSQTFLWKELSSLSSGATGNDQPHENRPPYYAVYYIMKVA